MDTHTKTLKVRVKNRHTAVLRRMAFECNQVWNEVNAVTDELGWIPIPEIGWMSGGGLSAFDLQKELKGIRARRGFIIGSATFQEIIAAHAKARRQFKKHKLRWRVSGGSKRSLGWVPFKIGAAKWDSGQVKFCGLKFGVFDSYGLKDYMFRSGSFSEDARGRWYFNVVVHYTATKSTSRTAIGIDLGLKDTATCSDGVRLERNERYREMEGKLAIAQRARNKTRVKAIHAKIKNRRADDNHKFSTRLVREHGAIFVGDVSSSKLAKTKMAKSVLDAGWFQLKTQLKYKAIARSVVFEEINEAYSTQTCSSCGVIPDSSPKGRAGLGVRHWICSCGEEHDRDINAALNILAAGGCSRLAGGIPVL